MPVTTPEARARAVIDQMLTAAGWLVQSRDAMNVHAGPGVAVCEFPLRSGFGFADYLLYVNARPAGVVEAKREGEPLTGHEVQTEKYSVGLPEGLNPHRNPLPFCYQSTGIETRFTNLLDPDARSRSVFSFHRPETLAAWLAAAEAGTPTLRARLREMPALAGRDRAGAAAPQCGREPSGSLGEAERGPAPVNESALWPAQRDAIQGLERSLAAARPRALIQMASGGGKTFTACNFCYRLIKHAGARRILFLVDRNNLGRQAKSEFENFTTPEEHRKFTELYNVQLLASNKPDPVAKVSITTIQRLFSMLRGEADLADPESEEQSLGSLSELAAQPAEVAYNPALPIEFFDFIVVDECHRSIYNLWRQVLEYFDAFLIGLTATPSKQTLAFFNQNLVAEYSHDQAVADGVNVGFDVYRILTDISEHGGRVDAGFWIDRRDRLTRRLRWEQLDTDFTYSPDQLGRDVIAKDRLRTVIATFRDKLFTEIFPGRSEVPKTLIFAKDDSHADDIVQTVREEFGKGNDFCEKITYRTGTARIVTKQMQPDGTEAEKVTYAGAANAETLLRSFRNSYNPRIAVTVDMIATGTDVRPLECLLFLRAPHSRTLFEQMKGRGARVVTPTDLQSVTPGATAKTHFVIVDAVKACESELSDTRPLEKQRTVSFETLLESVAQGNREPDVLSSLASRLARLDRSLGPGDQQAITEAAHGTPLTAIVRGLVDSLDPDNNLDPAEAAKPIASNPRLRQLLVRVKRANEQTIDTISQDKVLEACFSAEAREKARSIITSFETYLRDHKDELTALQILYSRPYRQHLTLRAVKELATELARPPRGWTPDLLWRAYQQLDAPHVHGSGEHAAADVVSLVRFALHQEGELRPFRDDVYARFDHWLAAQHAAGHKFSEEQRRWLEAIRDHISSSLAIREDDFDEVPFNQYGGLGRAQKIFGPQLVPLLDDLNEALPA